MAETIWNTVVMVFHFIMRNIVIINILLSLIIVFFERRSPQAVWTWLLLLYFIPIVGFILYLIIGQDYHKNKMFKAKEIEGELKYAVRRQEETIYHRQLKEQKNYTGFCSARAIRRSFVLRLHIKI